MKTVIRAIAAAVQKAPLVIVVVTLVLFGVFGYLSGQAEISQGNEGFAPENPELLASERITDLFGSSAQETVMQIIIRSEGDVFTADALDLVGRIEQALRESDGADAISDTPERPGVVSYLAPVQQAVAEGALVDDDVAVKSTYLQALQDPEAAARLGFVTALLDQEADPSTASASAALVLVFVESADVEDPDEAFDAVIQTETALADAVSSVDVPAGYEVRTFSFGLLFAEQDDFTSEVGRLFGYAALIILVILAFVYWMTPRGNATWIRSARRTAADTLLTLFTIFAAISFMQGMGVILIELGVIGSFNPVTQIIPVLLIGLGVDYGIHLTSRYREEIGTGLDVDGAIGRSIGTVGVALALATVTTAIGFLTNVFNPVPALKDFGILSAVGIVASFLLMLTFVPAARSLLDRRAEASDRLPTDGMGASSERLLPRIIEKASILAERAAVPTLVVAFVLGGLGVFGLTQLETRFSFTDFLPADAPAVETLTILQDEFGGGLGESSAVLVEGESDLATAEVHNALLAIDAELADVANVVTFTTPVGEIPSANSPLSLLRQQLQGGPEMSPPALLAAAGQVGLGQDFRVPAGTDITPLWDVLFEVAPEQAAAVLHRSDSGGYDALLVDLQTQAGENAAGQLRDDLVEVFAPLTDQAGITAIPTSQEIISAVIIDALSSSQTRSLLITLVIATIVLMISFWFENRRPMLGVLTMIPVALVVFWTYGMMYATGIPFGPVTATLAALAVGIGVPFTIHIARRFEEDRQRFDALEDALRSTTRHTGGALAGSAFTTMAGFGILMTSTLTPFRQMGQVTVYAVGLSLIGAVLVLPSLLALWEAWHRRRGTAAVERHTASVV
ncbi:MAG: MMPL family transporter [Acidimicrobiia bacterium]